MPQCNLDLSAESLNKRMETKVSSWVCKVYTAVVDEIVVLKALIFNKKHEIMVGASGKLAMLKYDATADVQELAKQVASKVECMGIIPQSSEPLSVVGMRPGNVDAVEETALLTKLEHCVKNHGTCVATAGDGGSIMQPYLQSLVLAFLARVSADGSFPWGVLMLGVLDCNHQLKSWRNAPAHGATATPHGGTMCVVDISLFVAVGAGQTEVRIKDLYSDFRVTALLLRVDMLATLQVPPGHKLGTMLWFKSKSSLNDVRKFVQVVRVWLSIKWFLDCA